MFRSLYRLAALALVATTLPLLGGSAMAAMPSCIVSLSPTATDTLFTIGAGAQIKAVDESSTAPAAAAALAKKDRINALNPSAEAIAGLCPSPTSALVVISYNANDLAKELTTLGVKVLEQSAPTNLAGAYAQIRQLGAATGHGASATHLAAALEARITHAIASVPRHPGRVLSVYYEISAAPYYSLTSATFVGTLLRRLGLVNIADPENTTADAGYPALNPEYIVKANPSLILLAGDAAASSVKHRSGWSNIAAVRTHHVVALAANEASQWGFLLGPLAQKVASAVLATLHDARLGH